MANREPIWNVMRSDHSERIENFLESGQYSDVNFIFENETTVIKAHRQFLALSSSVFEKMFYGDLKENNESVLIVGLESHIFHMLLKYLYAGNLRIDSIKQAIDLYMAADRFFLTNLSKTCQKYLQQNLQADSAMQVYEFAEFYQIADLQETAMNYCQRYTSEVLRGEGFYKASMSTLTALYQKNNMNVIDEGYLLIMALRYAKANGIELTHMIEVLKNIRFRLICERQIEHYFSEIDSMGDSCTKSIILKTLKQDQTLPDSFNSILVKRDLFNKQESFSEWETKPMNIIKRNYIKMERVEHMMGQRSYNFLVRFKLPMKIFGILVANQIINLIGSEESDDRLTYDENITVIIKTNEREPSMLVEETFNDSVFFDDEKWFHFDKPVYINSSTDYRIELKFRNVGYYPMIVCTNRLEQTLNVPILTMNAERPNEHEPLLGFKLKYL